MAEAAFHRVLDYPCRIVYGITDLSASYPYGGTQMGFVDEVEVAIDAQVYPITAIERPQSPVLDVVVASESWSASCIVRDADEDALGVVVPNSAFGATSSRLSITNPGSFLPGTGLLAARAKVVAFIPETVAAGNQDTHDVLVLYRALPYLAENVRLRMRLGRERPIPIRFWGVPDDDGRTAFLGRLADAAEDL